MRREYANDLWVEPYVWFHQVTPVQRQQHLDRVMATELKPTQPQQDAGACPNQLTDPICRLSISFEDCVLSRLAHAGSWQKASELVPKKDSMYPVPGKQQKQAFSLESRSGEPSEPHYVVMKPNGRVVCDCEK